MLEVEGGDPVSCMRILRHEAGHAIDNAYQVRRRPTRRRLFGNPSTEYPEYDVISTLRAMGHAVHTLGVHDDLGDIRRAATEWNPHIAFNLLEGFDDSSVSDCAGSRRASRRFQSANRGLQTADFRLPHARGGTQA
jgi:hypothetical protein